MEKTLTILEELVMILMVSKRVRNHNKGGKKMIVGIMIFVVLLFVVLMAWGMADADKKKTVPVQFSCHKCGRLNSEELSVYHKLTGQHKFVLNCQHCVSLCRGSEVRTINTVSVDLG